MKTVVIERDAHGEGQRRLHVSFRKFAKDYGFLVKLCRPYRPQTTGKMERYVRNNFYRPLVPKRAASGLPLDIGTLSMLRCSCG